MNQKLEAAQAVQHNTLSFQAERMNGNIERVLHLNEILEANLERLVGARPKTESSEQQGNGVSDTAGVLDYITHKNEIMEEQLSKAHYLLAEIATVI